MVGRLNRRDKAAFSIIFGVVWTLPRAYRPRHTMRQIAATRRCDKSPRLHCCCDKSPRLHCCCDKSHRLHCCCDKSPRLHCCCDKSLALVLSLRYVARIQTSLNSCDRSQRQ